MLHGVLLITLFACAAFYIGDMNWVKALSFSPMVVGIIIGMLYANSLRNNLPDTWVPGIKFCSKRILRTGIILYGNGCHHRMRNHRLGNPGGKTPED